MRAYAHERQEIVYVLSLVSRAVRRPFGVCCPLPRPGLLAAVSLPTAKWFRAKSYCVLDDK